MIFKDAYKLKLTRESEGIINSILPISILSSNRTVYTTIAICCHSEWVESRMTDSLKLMSRFIVKGAFYGAPVCAFILIVIQ